MSVRYGRHWALRDVSFELRAGQRWLLQGPNGAGKSVLLKVLRGDVWPTPTGREQRRYRIGRESHDQPAIARERIAYLGPERQDRYERYEWNLPAVDVVATGFFETDIPLDHPSPRQRRAALAMLTEVGLPGLADRKFLSLSYGQRRRVLLARALVRRPDVLLLDEALNGLDANSRRTFLRSLRRASAPRTAWILSSHRRTDVPARLTHAARLVAGRLEFAGPLADVADRMVGSPRVRRKVARKGGGETRTPGGEDFIRLRRVALYREYRNVIPRFDWTIAAGEHWCITGANGSGKSSLIALLYGDLWPALGGRIERLALPARAPVSDWKRLVGLVSPELQASYAATACSVEEIVASGLHSSVGLDARPSPAELRRTHRALDRVGLLHLKDRRARQLSYGQLRLALVARALIIPRRMLLLDEPFDGLDADVNARVHALVEAAVQGGTQVVLATHHREDVPAYVRKVLELRRGRVPAVVTSRR